MPIYPYRDMIPSIDKHAWVAPSADIIGDVQIDAGSNIWFGCTIRGDVNHIRIGTDTNIQDGTVIHVTRKSSSGNGFATIIGNRITIGHQCLLHGCVLEDECFIGMGAVVMDGAVVERNGFLAAGSLLTQGKRIKAGELWAGSPAKYIRPISDDERAFIPLSAAHYVALSKEYMQQP